MKTEKTNPGRHGTSVQPLCISALLPLHDAYEVRFQNCLRLKSCSSDAVLTKILVCYHIEVLRHSLEIIASSIVALFCADANKKPSRWQPSAASTKGGKQPSAACPFSQSRLHKRGANNDLRASRMENSTQNPKPQTLDSKP